MAELTDQQLYDKWKSRMSGAVNDVKLGVQNTKKSQTGNAVKAKDKYVARLQESIQKGTWEKKLKEAGDEAWKNGMLNKGADKIVTGINANEPKIQASMAMVNEVGKMARDVTKDMPNNTIEDGIEKVRANINAIRKAWGK